MMNASRHRIWRAALVLSALASPVAAEPAHSVAHPARRPALSSDFGSGVGKPAPGKRGVTFNSDLSPLDGCQTLLNRTIVSNGVGAITAPVLNAAITACTLPIFQAFVTFNQATGVPSLNIPAGSIQASMLAPGVIPVVPVIPAIPTSLPPNGTAGGALAGTYPNPNLAPGAVVGNLGFTPAAVGAPVLPQQMPAFGGTGADLACNAAQGTLSVVCKVTSINGVTPAPSFGTDATNSANIFRLADSLSGLTIRSLSKILYDQKSVRDFGAACDAGYVNGAWVKVNYVGTAILDGSGNAQAPTDDTTALNSVGANMYSGSLFFPGVCSISGQVGINNAGSLQAKPDSGNGLLSTVATGNLVYINKSNVSVVYMTFNHGVSHTSGADIEIYPAGGGTNFDLNDNVFVDPFTAIRVDGAPSGTISANNPGTSVSQVYVSRTRISFGKHIATATGAGCIVINPGASTDININELHNDGTSPTGNCIEATNGGDIAINNSGIAGFKRALLVDPGPGQQVVSLRAGKTFFDSSQLHDAELFANGGTIGRTDFFQSWVSGAAAGDGLYAHTSLIANGGTSTPVSGANSSPTGLGCATAAPGCQGQIVGLDLVGLEALGNYRHGVNLADYYVYQVNILGGDYAGNGYNNGQSGCGVMRSYTQGPFKMLGAVAGPWGFYGGNDYGLCMPNNGGSPASTSQNIIVKDNVLTGNRLSNNITVPQSLTEIIKDNIGFLTPCATFVPALSNATANVPLSTSKTSQACYTVDGGNVTIFYDLYIGTDGEAAQTTSSSLNIGLPTGLASGGGLPTQALAGFEDGITGSEINGRIGTVSGYYYGLVRAYDYANRYPGGTGAHIVLDGTYRAVP